MLVECTSEIQRSEKEWLEDFNQRRLEHNKASQQARWREEAEQRGETKGRKKKEIEDILAICDILSAEEIARRFKLDLSYVQSIIDSQSNK